MQYIEDASRQTVVYGITILPFVALAIYDMYLTGFNWISAGAFLLALLNNAVWLIAIDYLSKDGHGGLAWCLALVIPALILGAVIVFKLFKDKFEHMLPPHA
jgi:magnesium-transporting ATPase (P-type)